MEAAKEAKSADSTRARQVFLGRSLLLCGSIVLSLWAIDGLVHRAVERTGLLADVVDIQTPSILFAKLDYLRNFRGPKIVLLGDSIVFGRTLHEHGDRQWRQHNLSSRIADCVRQDLHGEDTLVLNLGINGALPADLECLERLLRSCPVDLVVFDVNLRSFSSDFSQPDTLLSRPWLAEIDIGPDGRLQRSCAARPFTEQMETRCNTFLTNYWHCYRLRDFLQLRLLDDQPSAFCQHLRGAIDQAAKPQTESTASELDDDFILLLKARARYKSVNSRPDNPQRQALERLLHSLVQRRQRTVVFYAKENPEVAADLMEADRYPATVAALSAAIAKYTGPDLVFVPPVPVLRPEHYLDHIHLNAAGYEVLADCLWAQARPLLRNEACRDHQ
jgi:lysophospholipase L1-like esterase